MEMPHINLFLTVAQTKPRELTTHCVVEGVITTTAAEPERTPESTKSGSRTQGSTARSMSPDSSARPNFTEAGGSRETPETESARDEIHARLGNEEAVRCFKQTKIRKASLQSKGEITRIYRELYALKGSVKVKLNLHAEQLQNKSRNFRCSLRMRSYYDALCCALRLRVPEGRHVGVDILEKAGTSKLMLQDERWTKEVEWSFNTTQDDTADAVLFAGTFSVVSVVFVVRDFGDRASGEFSLRFRALRDSGLEVRHIAADKGLIQTPLYRDRTFSLTPSRNLWARVEVPSGQVIMVSSPLLGQVSRCVTLYAEDRDNETLRAFPPHEIVYPPFVEVYNATVSILLLQLHAMRLFHLRCDDAGFGMNFSFHDESSPPAKVGEGHLWNCSTSDRSLLLLHHLSCNLEAECYDSAEDEEGCFYTTDICGPGSVALGGACFTYVMLRGKSVTWSEAAGVCSDRGGERMAVLNTPDKWKDAIRLVSFVGSHGLLVGIKSSSSNQLLYRLTNQWVDSTTAFYFHSEDWSGIYCTRSCGTISKSCMWKTYHIELLSSCRQGVLLNILCEKPPPIQPTRNVIPINGTRQWPRDPTYVECPPGHYTQLHSACDVASSCWLRDHFSRCQSSLTPLPPSFACADQRGGVPYTLVCDLRTDCVDGSDEHFCILPKCKAEQFACDNKQCVSSTKVCDGWGDCEQGEDENGCVESSIKRAVLPPPALVTVDSRGHLAIRPLNATSLSSSEQEEGICPYTHFQCPDNGYCLPLVLRCNDVNDCPGREDEAGCDDSCPGFYRCRASEVCVVHSDLCDGHPHCPQHDDELLCNATCPSSCVCRGLAFFCGTTFTASAYPDLRYLDASGSGMTPSCLANNTLLIHLRLAGCGFVSLDGLSLPNLLSLEIQGNRLSSMSDVNLVGVPQLRDISVSGNPMVLVFEEELPSFHQVLKLDLSRVVMPVLNVTTLSAFPSLRVLNLSHSGIRRVQGEGFSTLEHLRVIDLRSCPMTWFPRGLFRGLTHLQGVHAHSFKICCSAVLPKDFNLRNCFAPSDEISSCDDLLRGAVYKVCAFVLSLLAVTGNAGSFVFRTYFSKRESKLGYANFVTHLSVSDFLMGIYLTVIGVADQAYRGVYLWNDSIWKHSVVCKMAGFLSLLSSEVSAFIMCLITIDRFLVLRFPFSRFHFSPGSAHAASAVVWISGALLVSVPLLPVTSHWEFYSQTGICIPLPITRSHFAGYMFSFSILIVFNFFLFLVISLGQLSIYWSVRANAMSVSNTTKKTKDLTIARRLIAVAMTDFLCWFPIGVLGLMASSGLRVPGEVNVAVAIFILPLNSAVNPCLYTANVILERRRRRRDEKLRAFLLSQTKSHS